MRISIFNPLCRMAAYAGGGLLIATGFIGFEHGYVPEVLTNAALAGVLMAWGGILIFNAIYPFAFGADRFLASLAFSIGALVLAAALDNSYVDEMPLTEFALAIFLLQIASHFCIRSRPRPRRPRHHRAVAESDLPTGGNSGHRTAISQTKNPQPNCSGIF